MVVQTAQSSIDLKNRVIIIGGGPSGLMAAERASDFGAGVDLFDAMPSVGRKFLLAGKSGLNLSHAEPKEPFLGRYSQKRTYLEPHVEAFDATAIRSWAQSLGIDTFIGSSQKIFPTSFKGAPLLRAWLKRLSERDVVIHRRHRWLGWNPDGALLFETPEGPITVRSNTIILALGGGSWSRLGSDGAWIPWLRTRGLSIQDLKPSNSGFECHWTPYFSDRFKGHPIKAASLSFKDLEGLTHSDRGEFVITRHGVEGSLIYKFSAQLRDVIEARGSVEVQLDLAPDRTAEQLYAALNSNRKGLSLSNRLKRALGSEGVKPNLVRECLDETTLRDHYRLAAALKHVPLTLHQARPLNEAISSAGGVDFAELDHQLMVKRIPGLFCSGEMLDWEAPTGGYLLTACLATGRTAGESAAKWLTAIQSGACASKTA